MIEPNFSPGDLVLLNDSSGVVGIANGAGTRGTMKWDSSVPGILLKIHNERAGTKLWDIILPNGIGRCAEYRLIKVKP
jgi:hypothetical protein